MSSSSRSASRATCVEEHAARLRVVGRAVDERLDARLDDRQRRLQFVRHVGDEVLPDASPLAGLRSCRAARSPRPAFRGRGTARRTPPDAACRRSLQFEFLAVRLGRGEPLLDDLVERRLPRHLGKRALHRRDRVEPEQLRRPGRWRRARARSSMAITPSTMPERIVRSCSRSCSSRSKVEASRALIALKVCASVECSPRPETRISWPRSPSASRRAPSISSSSGRAKRWASMYAAPTAATSTNSTASDTSRARS